MAQGIGATLAWPALQHCQSSAPAYTPRLGGPDAALGHRLRAMDFGPAAEEHKTGVVIVGGGVAGLSAARFLKKHTNDFLLLEMADDTGGNSVGGTNAVSAYPWGAHYLPLPNDNDAELIAFLQEAGTITDFHNGLPVYNEYHLCFDPKERLYIHEYWQEGLLPHEGVPAKDRAEIDRFVSLMHEFKNKKGADGRDAFCIPVDQSSQDPAWLSLDTITMAEFLRRQGFASPYLLWYVDYCCADDFGATATETSAWAGIHYFASRKGNAHNTAPDNVLTWPEGNYHLVKALRAPAMEHIRPRALVYSVREMANGVEVCYFDAAAQVSKKIHAHAAIVCTPHFITHRLLAGVQRPVNPAAFQYAPWMVANITTDADFTERRGEPLSWDNVVYGSTSLGYVNAGHQHTGLPAKEKVITYYKPLTGADSAAARRKAQATTPDQWADVVLKDLQRPHPRLADHIQDMNVWLWGHGMIKPAPGFVWGADRKAACAPIGNRLHFAHSDLSGISIFEEAFYRGHRAAHHVLKTV